MTLANRAEIDHTEIHLRHFWEAEEVNVICAQCVILLGVMQGPLAAGLVVAEHNLRLDRVKHNRAVLAEERP